MSRATVAGVMRLAALAVLLITGCQYSLDSVPRACKPSTTVAACIDAERFGNPDPDKGTDLDKVPADLSWIQQNIFDKNCGSRDCHGVPDPGHELGGRFALTEGMSYQSLLGDGAGTPSQVADGRRLVVPMEPDNSYLLFLLRGVDKDYGDPPYVAPPSDVGYMPQKSSTLCCQKIDAVRSWIEDGAKP